jgi:alkylhydroperoxidase family enzyme
MNMARMEPLPIDASGDEELTGIFNHFVGTLGMVPNSLLTMQRVPPIAKATVAFNRAVFAPDGKVDLGLKRLVGHMASAAAGCQYCKAHTTVSATRHGVDDDKMAAIYEYSTSDLFSEAERAALDFALAAGSVPTGVTDEIYANLANHWDEDEIVEILGVVCMFGVFNRWNDSMATALEADAVAVTAPLLGDQGWEIGKHQ